MNSGIICEFNPFHKGHKYLIDSVKGENDGIICVMSGNFVQRGDCAVYSKFYRAKEALLGGADLIIELPTEFSTLSAQGFAKAGVNLLESTGICDNIAFGAECDDVNELKSAAEKIKANDSLIKSELEKGISYPAARRNATGSSLLDSPNNILAVEYLTYTSLNPIAVKRIGLGHDSSDEKYSASEIRKTLDENKTAALKNAQRAVLYKLRTMSAQDFLKIDDVSEGLENRIISAAGEAKTLEELCFLIKTKRYTMSRIRRIILRAFLGIEKDSQKEPSYIRILGFDKKGEQLLGDIKKKSSLPVITKYSDAKKEGGEVLKAFERECKYTDIFNLCYKSPRPSGEDQSSKIIRI